MFINIYADKCLLIFTQTNVYLYLRRQMFIYIYADILYIYKDTGCLFIHRHIYIYIYTDTQCVFIHIRVYLYLHRHPVCIYT